MDLTLNDFHQMVTKWRVPKMIGRLSSDCWELREFIKAMIGIATCIYCSGILRVHPFDYTSNDSVDIRLQRFWNHHDLLFHDTSRHTKPTNPPPHVSSCRRGTHCLSFHVSARESISANWSTESTRVQT